MRVNRDDTVTARCEKSSNANPASGRRRDDDESFRIGMVLLRWQLTRRDDNPVVDRRDTLGSFQAGRLGVL
jgi:hypothetical protein